MNGIRLVSRADDAGLNSVSNRAVRSAAREGIVRNISLMAPARAIEDAAEVLGPLGDTVDFGLHVCLTSEWESLRWGPVTANGMPGLLRRDGTFHLRVDEIEAGKIEIAKVMDEVAAQYDRLTKLGFSLSYLDEHMLVGEVPGLAQALAGFAEEKGLVNDRLLLADGRIVLLPGWGGPGEHPGTELADHLSGVESGTYLLIGHPGTKDDEMQMVRKPGGRPGEIALARNRERRMFMDIEIVDYCENVGIELLRYSQLR